MRSGTLNERVTITRRTEQVVSGEISHTETTLGPFWAGIKPLRGEALSQAQIYREGTSHEFKFRNVATFAPEDKLIWRGKSYEITSAIFTRQEQEWVVMAKEF